MVLGKPGRKSAPLGVFRMALGLVIASVLGAVLGLVWQSSGLGDTAKETVVTVQTPDA